MALRNDAQGFCAGEAMTLPSKLRELVMELRGEATKSPLVTTNGEGFVCISRCGWIWEGSTESDRDARQTVLEGRDGDIIATIPKSAYKDTRHADIIFKNQPSPYSSLADRLEAVIKESEGEWSTEVPTVEGWYWVIWKLEKGGYASPEAFSIDVGENGILWNPTMPNEPGPEFWPLGLWYSIPIAQPPLYSEGETA